jgi:predicted RNA methylase
LQIVQRHVAAVLDRAPEGTIRAVSLCAGQGRDLIGVLALHPRRADVVARLVELDERNVEVARAAAQTSGLDGIEVVVADASVSDAYEGAVPADLVLVCGVFGNISDADITRTIEFLPQLCAENASVIWTRHRRSPDATPAIRARFEANGFDEMAFDAPDDLFFGVGVNRLRTRPAPLQRGSRLFEFVGHDSVDR